MNAFWHAHHHARGALSVAQGSHGHSFARGWIIVVFDPVQGFVDLFPFLYGAAVDALSDGGMPLFALGAVGLIVAYGGARIMLRI